MTNNISLETPAVAGGPRLWLRAEGVVVFFLSLALYNQTGRSWWLFAALLLSPDVAMLGYLFNARLGAHLYNLAHSYAGPALASLFAVATGRQDWLPFVLIWTAHIAMDRALGYGLKYTAGFKQTHLGWVGGRKTA